MAKLDDLNIGTRVEFVAREKQWGSATLVPGRTYRGQVSSFGADTVEVWVEHRGTAILDESDLKVIGN